MIETKNPSLKKNETAASILERDLDLTIEHWLALVVTEKELTWCPAERGRPHKSSFSTHP
jgi:hypothetical protein